MSESHEDILAQANADAEEEYSGLEDIEAKNIGGALPAGRHLMRIVESKLGKAKNSGEPKFAVRLKLADGSSNKLVFKHCVLTGKGAAYTKGFLAAFGVDVSKPLKGADHVDRVAWITLSVDGANNNVEGWEAYDGDAEGVEQVV